MTHTQTTIITTAVEAITAENDLDRSSALDLIESLTILQQELDRHRSTYVYGARVQGASWAQIGLALGISKQAAQQRYAKHDA